MSLFLTHQKIFLRLIEILICLVLLSRNLAGRVVGVSPAPVSGTRMSFARHPRSRGALGGATRVVVRIRIPEGPGRRGGIV